jgi:hypothetical protein
MSVSRGTSSPFIAAKRRLAMGSTMMPFVRGYSNMRRAARRITFDEERLPRASSAIWAWR